jgi:hypothetical protein
MRTSIPSITEPTMNTEATIATIRTIIANRKKGDNAANMAILKENPTLAYAIVEMHGDFVDGSDYCFWGPISCVGPLRKFLDSRDYGNGRGSHYRTVEAIVDATPGTMQDGYDIAMIEQRKEQAERKAYEDAVAERNAADFAKAEARRVKELAKVQESVKGMFVGGNVFIRLSKAAAKKAGTPYGQEGKVERIIDSRYHAAKKVALVKWDNGEKSWVDTCKLICFAQVGIAA